MRLVVALLVLLLVFFLLVRLLPPAWYLPLYCLFVAAGIGYGYWEWRQIGRQRRALQRDLDAQRLEVPAELFAIQEEE